MNNIETYLPEKSENAVKVGTFLNLYTDRLYLVGSAARKWLYKLSANTDDFDFVVDPSYYDKIKERFAQEGYKINDNVWGTKDAFEIDCDSFVMKFRNQHAGDFLTSVAFCGDSLAINVASGKPICTPEFMNVVPYGMYEKYPDLNGPQFQEPWVSEHLQKLKSFMDEIETLLNKIREDLTAAK